MKRFNIYQSAGYDNVSIKRDFIVRQMEFQTIVEALSRHSTNPLRHELILGRRGSGKSTLLQRIKIEIAEKLNKKYIPIHLAEEQASIYRLFDLWLEIIEELNRRFSFQITTKEYKEFEKEQNYSEYLYQQIHEFCIARNKQIVLFLDNFDRIVENFTDNDHLFRETLIHYNDVVIIAASTKIDEHFWQHDKPFYEFFRLHHLEALTINEIKEFLNHWAEAIHLPELKKFAAKNSGKLQNIHIITDSLPRTIQLFIQLIVQNDCTDKGVDYLKMIMDNVTPLYQEQLNNLPPQLRKIVLEMAFIWEACNTKELAEKCRMESKLVSANLKTLTEKGIVDRIETNKRNLIYRISERFFNMWLIMTQGNPEQKRKASRLSIFLEQWYDATDLKERIFTRVEKNNNNAYYNLASMCYQQNKNKEKALAYIQQYEGCEDLRIIIELWIGIFNDVEKRALAVIKENPDTLFWFVTYLLIHQQKVLVLNLFNHSEVGQALQEKLKILHYICLILNKKTENSIGLKIPPEIHTTIDEVIDYIMGKEKFYKYRK